MSDVAQRLRDLHDRIRTDNRLGALDKAKLELNILARLGRQHQVVATTSVRFLETCKRIGYPKGGTPGSPTQDA